ncbi:hypothetical protein F5X68DRAFT_249266 [Plectosphaerella plurivora]|uniref:DUF6590 domain-containing protein n=1 Tax=Plectosphaerella plurivora TaxID=936078 RepID=A0A9P8V2Q8_9PEZI|nr:hypothetical protein F5X68DRAFT_249266 [Plectosphaerella plurivora]
MANNAVYLKAPWKTTYLDPYDTPRNQEETYQDAYDIPRDQDDVPGLDALTLEEPEPVPASPGYITDAPHGKGKGLADPEPDDPEDGDGNASDTPTEGTVDGTTDDLEDEMLRRTLQESRESGLRGLASGSTPYPQNSDYLEEYGMAGDPAYGPPAEAEPVPDETDSVVQGEPVVGAQLDSRYRIYKSKHWTPGTVFKVYWSEPMGSNGDLSVSGRQVYANEFGSFYTGFRRFIVVASDEGNSTCVPVATYSGQGCRKHGVKASKHGLILAQSARSRTKPKAPKNIEALGFPMVRMNVTAEGETLSLASRINYSKLVTIEHNIKILMIGHIATDHFENFNYAVNTCWSGKKHFPPGYMNQHS